MATIQILWADPRERRFRSGDVLDEARQAELGVNAQDLLDAREAQLLDPPAAPARRRKKEG